MSSRGAFVLYIVILVHHFKRKNGARSTKLIRSLIITISGRVDIAVPIFPGLAHYTYSHMSSMFKQTKTVVRMQVTSVPTSVL